MRLLEALIDADPDAEAETEDALEQADQNEPAVDVFHGIPSVNPSRHSDSRAETTCKARPPASQTRTEQQQPNL